MFQEEVKKIQQQHRIIGREEELSCALAAAYAGKHILLEGAVGVGKTVIALALARHLNRKFYRVDGDERYTEHKLTGWFDPSAVMAKGYSWETFIPGPLTQAMMEGALLFINELNRMPEGTQNVLLPAMDEGRINIPKIGVVESKPTFLIIATQNPEEFVGTSRLGEALKDRFVWIRLNYQSGVEECEIVKKETGCEDEALISTAVKIARKTREDPDIRRGSSVRGAIDLVDLVRKFAGGFTADVEVWVKAAMIALPTKIELQDQTTRKVDELIKKIVTSSLSEVKAEAPVKTSSQPEKSDRGGHAGGQGFQQALKDRLTGKKFQPPLNMLAPKRSETVGELLLEGKLFKEAVAAITKAEPSWLGLHLLASVKPELEPEYQELAKRLLIRMIVRLAAQISWRGLSATYYGCVPFKPGMEEFDVEQTYENWLGNPCPGPEDIVGVEKFRKKNAVAIMFDTSNSMQMSKIVTAALAVGVLAYKLKEDHHSIITFKEKPEVLKGMTENLEIETLVGRILDHQPGGLTNIRDALAKGLEELERVQVHRQLGIMVTDGWVTYGGDPVEIAEKYPRLHVIQVPLGVGGGDPDMCRTLAKAGRGKYSYMRSFYHLPQAILSIL